MPWAGAQFNLVYNWLNDRDTGVKIRAARMMEQEQDLADGMEQTLLRNGLNSPTTDIDWATHIITNYGPAGSPLLTKEQVSANLANAEWIPEALPVTRIASNSFTVGGDVTPVYRKGRRVKLTYTSSGSDANNRAGTVIADSTFASGVTTVVIEMDLGPTVIDNFKNLYYSLVSTSRETLSGAGGDVEVPGPSVFDWMSRARVRFTAGVNLNVPVSVTTTMPFARTDFDERAEFAGGGFGGKFIAQMTGYYWFHAVATCNWTGNITTGNIDLLLVQTPPPTSGTGYTSRQWAYNIGAGTLLIVEGSALMRLAKGDSVYAAINQQSTPPTPLTVTASITTRMEVHRLPGV